MATSSTKTPVAQKSKTTKSKSEGGRQTSLFDSFLKRNDPPPPPPPPPPLPPSLTSITSESARTPSVEIVSTERVTEYLRLASLEPTLDPAGTPSVANVSEAVTPLTKDDHAVVEIGDSPVDEQFIPMTTSQGTAYDPIVIAASPERVKLREHGAHTPFNNFFVPRTSQAKTKAPALKSKDTSKRTPDAPYPTGDSQHIRGEQRHFTSAPNPLKRRRVNSVCETYSDLSPNLSHILSSIGFDEKISRQVSLEMQQYPISHVSDATQVTPPSQKLWAEKWRPTRAEHVLGNKENAIYLRDWLHALELQLSSDSASNQTAANGASSGAKNNRKAKEVSKKRPRVIRAVERKKKKRRTDWDEEDDWIVDDEYYSEDPILDSETCTSDDFDLAPAVDPIPVGAYPSGSTQDIVSRLEFNARAFDSLTNTILLAGPSGAGKTAAVYACAEELGYEVFEVYPGIGKRNGAGIDDLIGEVGKNHHVKAKSSGMTKHPAGFFRKAQTPVEEPPPLEESPESAPVAGLPEAEVTARQSLILLEEVDILFKDDAGFWPSVIDFIKSCKRPVICTCNDVSAIPTEDLPLQTILIFQPCPAAEAASYLHYACSSEGFDVDVQSLRQLYELPLLQVGSSSSFPALPPEIVPRADLRRTIHNLQLQCSTLCHSVRSLKVVLPEIALLDTMFDQSWVDLDTSHEIVPHQRKNTPHIPLHNHSCRIVANHADLISFTDSYLTQCNLDISENKNGHKNTPPADDEADHHHAVSPGNSWLPLGSFSEESSNMGCTALLFSRGILGKEYSTGPTSTNHTIDRFGISEMFRARINYHEHVSTAVEGIIPPMLLATRRSDVCMDYVPYIREIISAEDIQEEMALLKEKPGRTTRNSARSRYKRSVEIRPEQRAALSVTAFSRTL